MAGLDDLIARVSAADAPRVKGDIKRHPGFKNMAGVRVGSLIVREPAPTICGNARWRCDCDCGRRVVVDGIRLRTALKRGKSLSCPGCRTAARG